MVAKEDTIKGVSRQDTQGPYESKKVLQFRAPRPVFTNCEQIDLNELLVENFDTTFFVTVKSGALAAIGIHKGDLLIVDSSLPVEHYDVVCARRGDEIILRRFEDAEGERVLKPASRSQTWPYISPDAEGYTIIGKVTHSVRKLDGVFTVGGCAE